MKPIAGSLPKCARKNLFVLRLSENQRLFGSPSARLLVKVL